MHYKDLRDFIGQLERNKQLRRIDTPVQSELEITEISQRVLHQAGPALLFQNVTHQNRPNSMPVLANLFGTPERVALGMGAPSVAALRDIGELLASLREPEPPLSRYIETETEPNQRD